MLQGSLLTTGDPEIDASAPTERITLSDHAWIDLTRDFLRGADAVFADLVDRVEWKQGRRKMWDRVLDDPRLSRWYGQGEGDPHPALADVRHHLERRYGIALRGVGLNYYRDGRDSVAFHADRELRELDDTLVCILTLGGRRPFLVRPKGRGRSRDLAPGSGDLLVMGGACQRDFEHGIPKVAHADPRVSSSWRWANGPDRPGIV